MILTCSQVNPPVNVNPIGSKLWFNDGSQGWFPPIYFWTLMTFYLATVYMCYDQ